MADKEPKQDAPESLPIDDAALDKAVGGARYQPVVGKPPVFSDPEQGGEFTKG